MLRFSFLMILAPAVLAAGVGFSDDLTDEGLLEILQNHREAFEKAKTGGQGEARGLVLMTVDSALPASDLVDPTVPAMTNTANDAPEVALSGTETGATVLLPATSPQQPVTDANQTAAKPIIYGAFSPGIQVNLDIKFAFDSATLQADQTPVLAQMCRVMKASSGGQFRIVGHTDAAGTAEYNQSLSQVRAEEVRRYLVDDCGIEAGRLEAIGFGERFLYNSVDPKAAINRRDAFQALS